MKKYVLLLSIPLSALLLIAASALPGFAEGYANTVYFALSRAVNFLSSLVPVSLAEFLCYALVLAVPVWLALFLRRMIRGRGRRGAVAGKAVLHLLSFAGVVFLLYTLNCGINYSRFTFSQISGLSVRPSSKAELASLCSELAQEVSSERISVSSDSDGIMALRSSVRDTGTEARDSFDRLETLYPTLRSGYGAPKPVLSSRLMSQCNLTGVYFPFTFEANVNVDVPDYSIPATMCHELSHLRGYMREDEANFIAYLACRESSSPDFRYSGSMLAFIYVSNAMYSSDRQEGQKIYDSLSDGVRRDLDFNSDYWKQFEGPVADISDSVNDAYLKSNHQEDGVKSYDRMTDLLLADYRARHHLS